MTSVKTDLVVLGAGPGGYAAAFYAADKGKKVVLVESDKRLGGVCLNKGCIPSKALLHATKLVVEAKDSEKRGIRFGAPNIDLARMRTWKESILEKLGQGIATLAQKRGVTVLRGKGLFDSSKTLRVETSEGQKFIDFKKAIIAVGSKPAMPPAFDLGNKRIITSTQALDLKDIPAKFLIVGGGYIGMEIGTVYAALGSKVVVTEALPSILAGADPDLARPVMRYAENAFSSVRLGAKVLKMATSKKEIRVTLEIKGEEKEELYDKVLVSVGRVANCNDIGLENTKVQKDDKGFIKVNSKQETTDLSIYAIGDVAGGFLLAHKAAREARIAVDVMLGKESGFENIIIPAVVFTDPEVAWCGLTETEARRQGIPIRTARYPWGASGRALSFDRTDGLTKLIVEPGTERVLGVGIVGAGAGELIAEGVLAVEMGATVRDLAEVVHPHPTLSETLMECAEVFYGTSTHTFMRKKS